MRNTLGIRLSTATIGIGAIASAAPAAANPALVVPLAAAAAGGLVIGGAASGQYSYEWQGSDRWKGQTQVAPPAGYAEGYPPTAYIYPDYAYPTPDYAYPTAYPTPPYGYPNEAYGYGYGPGYRGTCHVQSQRVPTGAGNAEWQNYMVCD
jgi:hypothetical protein